MAQCTHCFLDLNRYPPSSDSACPNCGTRNTAFGPNGAGARSSVGPMGPGAPMVLLGRFWTSVRDIILRPARFFSSQSEMLVSEGGLSTALAFAVIVQWLASFFNFVWRSTAGVLVQDKMSDLFRIAGDVIESRPGMAESLDGIRERAVEFLFGAGAIVLTPFTTLLKLMLIALLVHAAVRFFMKEMQDRPHRYSTTLKILAYSTAPWILCIIPGIGVVVAWLLAFSAGVIGIREVYRTTTGRAVLAIVFPELLFAVFLFGMVVFFLFLALNVMRLVF